MAAIIFPLACNAGKGKPFLSPIKFFLGYFVACVGAGVVQTSEAVAHVVDIGCDRCMKMNTFYHAYTSYEHDIIDTQYMDNFFQRLKYTWGALVGEGGTRECHNPRLNPMILTELLKTHAEAINEFDLSEESLDFLCKAVPIWNLFRKSKKEGKVEEKEEDKAEVSVTKK